MRFPVLVSLLLPGSTHFVESAKNKPSSLREILQRYPARREELLQRNKDQITKRFLAQIQGADANPRELQGTDPLCNSDGSLNFDDDYTQVLYDGDFLTKCNCSEESNELEVSEKINALNATNLTRYAQEYNALLGTAFSSTFYSCLNSCETCYDGVCAILETMEEGFLDYSESNFTAANFLVGGSTDLSPFTTNFSYSYTECVQYTSGTALSGKLCFRLNDDPLVSFSDTPCVLDYDGVACNSCIFPAESDLECFIADCTNIDASAMIDSCNLTGFVGPFIFWGLLEIENITSIPLTVGSCDVLSSPTSPSAPAITPTTPTSVDAPITAPTSPTAIDIPVTTPTAPISVEAPVTPPKSPASVDAPVASPSAPTSATSPVTAPVKTPTVSLPSAPTTSGSVDLGRPRILLVLGFGTIATFFF